MNFKDVINLFRPFTKVLVLDRDCGVGHVMQALAYQTSDIEELSYIVIDDIEISGDLAIIYMHKETPYEY